ncbi:MFS transporter [Burkholderia oklahomensis]|uniref:MFS transporter n=1 Tax=Burkholderia oklahomensis TaxID=342113 RepID=UPI00016A9AA4|nr:MFS transporter [Burkholderia oklahomensis]AJX32148.1 hexuronate transporter [Burkholderia oklahomensis C6786]AOI47479.1 hexuronate transporter [Burkholderia oklahomensis C6786]KUY61752.1 hexuronate transporter [Burkholderia oklahomensis C6786]MBI0359796.1 MFS transporter [Burkholderia oklahomensis]SUW59181.1 Hexuronate transporter [Burkholderia oklahomensis]
MNVKRIGNVRWWMIGLVTLGLIVNYLARNALATAAPEVNKLLNISTQQYGFIVASFQAAYMVMQPIAGYALDLLGTRLGFALFALAWSLVCMLHGTAGNWIALAAFRAMLGITEAAGFPSALKATSEWFPAHERSIATGWFNIGSSVGALIAPPLVVWCMLHGSWRIAFVVVGALGFVWSALWFAFYRSPAQQPRLTAAERDYIVAGQEAPRAGAAKPSWGAIVKSRRFWGLAIPRFLSEPAWQTFNFWIPLYMATVRHMNLKEIAMFAWLPFLAADLGCLFGGYLAPWYRKRFGTTLIASRKMVMATGALCMIGPACIGLATSPYTAIALFCVGGFAHQTLSGALYTLASDVFGRHEVATATGLAGMSGYLGATLFSLAVGALVAVVGYDPLFVALAAFDIVGAVVVWTLLPDAQPRAPSNAAPEHSPAASGAGG